MLCTDVYNATWAAFGGIPAQGWTVVYIAYMLLQAVGLSIVLGVSYGVFKLLNRALDAYIEEE